MNTRIYRVAGISMTLLILKQLSIFPGIGFLLFLASTLLPITFIALIVVKKVRGVQPSSFQFSMAISAGILFAISILDPLPKGAYLRWFDSEEWLSEATWKKSPTQRRMMLGSLYWVESLGWSEKDLQEKLGETAEYFQSLVKDKPGKKVYSYRIDNEDGLISIDSQWLVFTVNQDGKIVEKRIMTD